VAGGQAPSITISGADPANSLTKINLDITGATQFASASIVKPGNGQDGYTKGDLIAVAFSSTGEMIASFSNGQDQTLGVVAIASFENQSGLQPSGDTEWSATFDSGDASLNPPGTGLNGTLRSAALEASNVDLSAELVKLIEGQRNYQANSKTLETMNTVTQTILQI
jgi:flagellar hook protein FlgE